MNNVIDIKVDFNKESIEEIVLKQYSVGQILRFTITAMGDEVSLKDCGCILYMDTPDGRHIMNPCSVISNNIVTTRVTTMMTLVDGDTKCELSVADGNGVIIKTMQCKHVKIVTSAVDLEDYGADIIASDEYEAVKHIENLNAEVSKCEQLLAESEANVEQAEAIINEVEQAKEDVEKSKDDAEGFANDAKDYSDLSKMWAVGTTEEGTPSDTNNSEYYCNKAKEHSDNCDLREQQIEELLADNNIDLTYIVNEVVTYNQSTLEDNVDAKVPINGYWSNVYGEVTT